SRRRHTRSKRDWSSDVCSSDLNTFSQKEVVFTSLIFKKLLRKLMKLTILSETYQLMEVLFYSSELKNERKNQFGMKHFVQVCFMLSTGGWREHSQTSNSSRYVV